MNDILVTVICATYNHEKYIERTLLSLVNQKTDFRYEIIVHDDASTDNTQKIIKEIEKKYSDKVVAVLQRENQLSQGKNITYDIIRPLSRGKYFAICEGDDYWLDSLKLQKQVDYMESHPLCTFCFSNGVIENVQNGKTRRFVPYLKSDKKHIKEDGDYDVKEIAALSFIPTCTFFYPKNNWERIPEYFFDRCFGGDRRVSLYFTAMGYAHFIDEELGAYNYGVAGSELTKWRTKEQIANIELTYAHLYENVDRFTGKEYHEYFNELRKSFLFTVYCLQGNDELMTKNEYKLIESDLNIFIKIKKKCFDFTSERLFNFIRQLKRKYSI